MGEGRGGADRGRERLLARRRLAARRREVAFGRLSDSPPAQALTITCLAERSIPSGARRDLALGEHRCRLDRQAVSSNGLNPI